MKAYLEQNEFIDNTNARKVTDVTQTDEMSRILANWVAEGLLKKISPDGSKKNTLYTLPSRKNSIKPCICK